MVFRVFHHVELNGNEDGDEDVVFGLGLHLGLKLLQLGVDSPYRVDERDFELQSAAGDALETRIALDERALGLAYRKQRAKENNDDKNYDQRQTEDRQRIHVSSLLFEPPADGKPVRHLRRLMSSTAGNVWKLRLAVCASKPQLSIQKLLWKQNTGLTLTPA